MHRNLVIRPDFVFLKSVIPNGNHARSFMYKYICSKSDAEVDGIIKRINIKNAIHELYVTKARAWLKTHHIGNIVKGWVLHKQLELVARDGERFPMLFTVSLDSGSTSVVRGREKDLLQNDF